MSLLYRLNKMLPRHHRHDEYQYRYTTLFDKFLATIKLLTHNH
jgi:hypothetical protein